MRPGREREREDSEMIERGDYGLLHYIQYTKKNILVISRSYIQGNLTRSACEVPFNNVCV